MKDINLLLKEERSAPGEEEVQVKSGKAAGAAKTVAILVLVAAFVGLTLVAPKAYVAVLNAKADDIEKELSSAKYQEVKSINTRLEEVSGELSGKEEILESVDKLGYTAGSTIKAIKNNVPQGCSVNSLELDGSSVKVSAKFSDTASVAEFLLNMERLNYVSLSDSSKNLKINKNGEYVFSFILAPKTGAKEGQ